ncbi:MAG TPA: alpha/beta hydrolase [Xanthomonadales bacterium]|nr:alpha/beta hydrolase [Xanthomonadales bacterium]
MLRLLLTAMLPPSIPPVLLAQTEPKVAGVAELLAMPEPAADFRFQYGDDPLQFADLRLPSGDGPFPVVVLVHGGCWLAQYGVGHLGAMAEALTDSGVATWTLEFRRIGNEGGGWPGTFLDVSRGVDLLRDVAADHALDLDRVILVGHSAGGHLALWLAGRHKLPPDSPLYLPDPLPVKGVIGLAPAADLELTYRNQTCGDAAQRLIGGTPEEFPQRYREGSPAALLPLGVPQLIINGALDEGWLIVSRAYQEKARALGEEVRLVVPPDAGHFELVMPMSSTFPVVREAIEAMLQ